MQSTAPANGERERRIPTTLQVLPSCARTQADPSALLISDRARENRCLGYSAEDQRTSEAPLPSTHSYKTRSASGGHVQHKSGRSLLLPPSARLVCVRTIALTEAETGRETSPSNGDNGKRTRLTRQQTWGHSVGILTVFSPAGVCDTVPPTLFPREPAFKAPPGQA